MKVAILMTLGLIAHPSFAEEPVSGERMASLLSSSKVAPCLAKLYQLEARAELLVEGDEFVVVKDNQKKEIRTTIQYFAIQGGDMALGNATITVIEKLHGVPFAPAHVLVPKVEGCEFDSNIGH